MSPALVLDASAALAWLFEESGSASIKDLLNTYDLIAPALWRLEVANGVLMRERRKLINETQAAGFLASLDDLPVTLVPDSEAQTVMALAQLARAHSLTTYDATYLDLAMRRGLPLLTRDGALREAAQRVGLTLAA